MRIYISGKTDFVWLRSTDLSNVRLRILPWHSSAGGRIPAHTVRDLRIHPLPIAEVAHSPTPVRNTFIIVSVITTL